MEHFFNTMIIKRLYSHNHRKVQQNITFFVPAVAFWEQKPSLKHKNH